MGGTVILILIVVAVLLWAIVQFNGLVSLRNAAKNGWSQIDVQLKRRHDLIPNLVETAKGYMTHERETLEKVVQARNMAVQPQGVGERGASEGKLSQALSGFFAVAERYPDLKANQNFLALQEELTSTENKISFARQAYNDQVMRFNNKIEMFPSSVLAGMFHFEKSPFFEIEDATERAVPKVSFS